MYGAGAATQFARCSRKAGVAPGQEVVTYCAVGMRASLMHWAAVAHHAPREHFARLFGLRSQGDIESPVAVL